MAAVESFETVLGAARQGEEWAFAVLYREFNPRLLRYFAARVPTQAEDLAAETWVGVARQVHSFHGDRRAFHAWLFTIAYRRLIQHWREQARRPTPDSRAELPESCDPVDVEQQVLDEIGAQQAVRAIARSLTTDQADVLLLRILGDLDVDQVAKILGKRPGTIRVLQHRALRRLAGALLILEAVTL